MKNYTALFLLDPYSAYTKSGFKTIKDSERYIRSKCKSFSVKGLGRQNWLVIETKALSKHLDNLDIIETQALPKTSYEFQTKE